MTTYAVGQRIQVRKDVCVSSDNKRMIRYYEKRYGAGVVIQDGGDLNWKDKPYLVTWGGWNVHFAADELEPAPDAQTTLTQALEALRETTHLLATYSGAWARTDELQDCIKRNRALLQAANAEPDAAAGEAG